MRLLIITFILSAASVFAADVTGKWRGSTEFTDDNGESRKGSAFLNLKQEGSTITGTAGPNETNTHTVKSGQFANNRLTFTITTDQATMKADLLLKGDELNGQVTRDDGSSSRVMKLVLKREQ